MCPSEKRQEAITSTRHLDSSMRRCENKAAITSPSSSGPVSRLQVHMNANLQNPNATLKKLVVTLTSSIHIYWLPDTFADNRAAKLTIKHVQNDALVTSIACFRATLLSTFYVRCMLRR